VLYNVQHKIKKQTKRFENIKRGNYENYDYYDNDN